MKPDTGASSPFLIYYAATAIFLLLDYFAGFNMRIAFLDAWPGWRALYYVFCFACLGLMMWRPSLTLAISTGESLITLVALITSFGTRVIGGSVNALEGGGFVGLEEILNFLVSGMVAWWGWTRGSLALQKQLRP